MPTLQATKKKQLIESIVPIQRVQDAAEQLRDILGAIELRAFELFERRGGECGRDLEDWLAAEAELVYRTSAIINDQADRVEVRIGVEGVSPQTVAVLLTEQKLVVRGEAWCESGPGHKWMLVRIDLPASVNPDSATAVLESSELAVTLRKV
jgi:HSP20 family molecular chaperone IbpA